VKKQQWQRGITATLELKEITTRTTANKNIWFEIKNGKSLYFAHRKRKFPLV